MKIFLPLFLLIASASLHADLVNVYFGTGGGDAKGIYRATLDKEKGKLSKATLAAEIEKPGFLTFHPDRTKLYAVANPASGPIVAAYRIEENGDLTFLQEQPMLDGQGAHLSVHPSGNFLLTAQYGGGSTSLFPLDKDGNLLPCKDVLEHEGGSRVVGNRQNSPHPHWTGFSPDGRFAFVPDLGLDQIVIYKVKSDNKSIKPVGFAESVSGGGPRHMKFSVDGDYIFLLNELSLSLSTFAYDAEKGTAELLSTTPTISEAMKAKESFNSASEILVHPNGKYVYSANRGHDSVTAFQIDPETGRLYVIDIEHVRGAFPRNINLDSSGQWLLAAGAHSDTVAVFSIDSETGELTYPLDSVINVPSPICVLLND